MSMKLRQSLEVLALSVTLLGGLVACSEPEEMTPSYEFGFQVYSSILINTPARGADIQTRCRVRLESELTRKQNLNLDEAMRGCIDAWHAINE